MAKGGPKNGTVCVAFARIDLGAVGGHRHPGCVGHPLASYAPTGVQTEDRRQTATQHQEGAVDQRHRLRADRPGVPDLDHHHVAPMLTHLVAPSRQPHLDSFQRPFPYGRDESGAAQFPALRPR